MAQVAPGTVWKVFHIPQISAVHVAFVSDPRAKSQEPRAKSQEPRAKSQEPRADPSLGKQKTLADGQGFLRFSVACLRASALLDRAYLFLAVGFVGLELAGLEDFRQAAF